MRCKKLTFLRLLTISLRFLRAYKVKGLTLVCQAFLYVSVNVTSPALGGDTNYNQFERMTLAQIMEEVRSFSAKNIIITGGEPTIVPNIELLLNQMKSEGYFLAIETNGLKPIPTQIDYIATSPKRLYQHKYEQRCIEFADEVRIVADGDVSDFCALIEENIQATRYYLSPCEINGKMNLLETITQLGLLNQRPNKPKWLLSVQTHKLIGIA